MKKQPALLCLALCVLSGCDSGIGRAPDRLQNEPAAPASTQNPRFPKTRLFVSKKGDRSCSIGVVSKIAANGPRWGRIYCGIDHVSYGARLDYLHSNENADRYRIIVYKPFPEDASSFSEESIFEQELYFSGPRIEVFSINGVTFTMAEEILPQVQRTN